MQIAYFTMVDYPTGMIRSRQSTSKGTINASDAKVIPPQHDSPQGECKTLRAIFISI